jgi:glycine C-acetyltransferase/8-amino-7-oxononanoate synthase
MESAPGARTVIDGKEVDYFAGTGYYCLQGHPEVIEAAVEAVKKYGVSSATSLAGFGNTPVSLELEANAARFFGTESVICYASGCLGNSILLEALADEYDAIFADKESHYSIMNAAYMVYKPVIVFEDSDPDDLRKKLKTYLEPSQRPVVICDGIFPISGQISPIPRYVEVLADIQDAIICVDDAHAFGIIGEKGRGTFEYFGLTGKGLYSSGTLGKAFGSHGGIITGDSIFIKKLKEKSTIPNACSCIAIPAAAAAAKSFEILNRSLDLRKKLWDNTAYAKNGLRKIGFSIDVSPVPIICLHSLKDVDFQALQLELLTKNIVVSYLAHGGYTSVPPGGALRISIFSGHTHEQIDYLIETIQSLI